MNSSDIATYIKVSINQPFSFRTALGIPNINLNNHYVGFRQNFDNFWFRCKSNIIKNMYSSFDYIRNNRNISIFNEI